MFVDLRAWALKGGATVTSVILDGSRTFTIELCRNSSWDKFNCLAIADMYYTVKKEKEIW